MAWKHRCAGYAGILAFATACHGDCYDLRIVETSGRFGDTLVAVSGDGTTPGTVSLRVSESAYPDYSYRNGFFALNATGIVDTVSLYRLTLVSDPSRTSLFTATSRGDFVPDTTLFNKLWVHLATEDVLFEIVGKNGGEGKALLNLESRDGPKRACEPYT